MDYDQVTDTITPTETQSLTLNGTGCLCLTSGTTAQRPVTGGVFTLNAGALRYNTTIPQLEWYNGTTWLAFGLQPASPSTSIQYNNAGVFGGNASFEYIAGANPQVTITGTIGTNQLRIGGNTAAGAAAATVYIETNATDQDGQLIYFNSGTSGTSGFISYAYDGSTPYLRLTDSDDDPPYITFNTIGTGTYAAPLYVSAFGARGTYGSRTAGANSGFAWYIGANTTANALITAATPIMEMDTNFISLPSDTTANRPGTPQASMIRFNTDINEFEGYTDSWAALQNSLGGNRAMLIGPNTGANFSIFNTAITVSGGNTIIANPTLTTTTLPLTSTRRVSLSSGATAGGVAFVHTTATECWRGNAAGLGGFTFKCQFGTETLNAGTRVFVGLTDTAITTNINTVTSTTPGRVGMAINTNTGDWNLIHNVTGTAPTSIALGANFPVNNSSVYELVLYAPPDSTTIFYRVTSFTSGNVTAGSFTANIPSTTTFLMPQAYITNNATATATLLSVLRMYLETNL